MTARFPGAPKESLDIYKMWIDESYRAVAPKKLVARLDDGATHVEPRVKPIKSTTAAKKTKKR